MIRRPKLREPEPVPLSRASATYQVENQRNHRDDQQKMNRASGQVQPDPHDQPYADQHEEENQKQEIANQPHVTLLQV
jgi:hypothetical protein